MLLIYISVFSILGSLGAVVLAGGFILFPERVRESILPALISYATGTLLGAAFLGLIPQAMESSNLAIETVLGTVLLGTIGFFILEKLVIWRHCHIHECDVHETSGSLIVVGDAFHNFVDGVVIAASFSVSIPLGLAASFSIISHEIPQEVGDFAILLKNKYSPQKAFGLNVISGLSALLGALLTYFFLNQMEAAVPYIMALAAASFIYIAISDLIPHLHTHTRLRDGLYQTSLILMGIATIYFIGAHNHG